MIEKISMGEIYSKRRLYLDYLVKENKAVNFFTYMPDDFSSAIKAREKVTYRREAISLILQQYNRQLNAHQHALENIDALQDPLTMCVVCGQQAGFLCGPVYTFYKIVTTIRLAQYLQHTFKRTFVPIFWLATEDHDFQEINHIYFLQANGDIGKIQFLWERAGCPITDLTVEEQIMRAWKEYFEKLIPGSYYAQTQRFFTPEKGEHYCTWNARLWSGLFSDRGLVVVVPEILRVQACDFFQSALRLSTEIEHRLNQVAEGLIDAGYVPELPLNKTSRLFIFDGAGRRRRIKNPKDHISSVIKHPERYSSDAALRPILSDTVFPSAVNVLGPGEIEYHAMIKPLYELFTIPQPLLFPRKSYTILSKKEAEMIHHYSLGPQTIVKGQLDIDETFYAMVPRADQESFDMVQQAIENALFSIVPSIKDADPNLQKTFQHTVSTIKASLGKLKHRTIKAKMSKLGFSQRDLLYLSNALRPKGKPQERMMPLPHFINRYGFEFADSIFNAGALEDFSHYILTIED